MAYQEGSVSSQEKGPKPIVYALDERRRAALAEVDNAKFSYVPTLHAEWFILTCFLQVVPRQGLSRCWCRFLHRCVSSPRLHLKSMPIHPFQL